MKEKFLEDVFVEYPTLIEPGLVFIQRQVPLNNGKRRIDLQYQDKNGNNLFVELKRCKFRREDVRQIIEYYKHIKRANDPNIRLMVIAKGFCPEARLILRYLGVELKKILLSLNPTDLG
ncbi:MAG: endonuclease NucS domain-containing protein [Candidatus Heimdallarchaeota archaeon]